MKHKKIKSRLLILMAVLMPLISFNGSAVEDSKLPETAPCTVCSANGKTSEMPIKARSQYQGEIFYFCTVACKDQFDKDPLSMILGPIPRPMPDFTAETLKGEKISLKSKKYKGQIILIDFWATWCLPCLETMPELERIQQKHKKGRNVTVLGISLESGTKARQKIQKVIKEKKVSYPVWQDTKKPSAFETFKLKSVPTLFLIDQKRQIVAQWAGKADHKAIEKQIQVLLNKK